MQKLIKNIREYLNISQAEFAEKLGVTFATVNRWENNKTEPSYKAIRAFEQLCKENGIQLEK